MSKGEEPGTVHTHWGALDGLRGVAVLLVVASHAGDLVWRDGRSWMAPGGHLGVHLFFVLSGFLITVLLLKEVDRTGRIAMGAFARRRVLRLLPALAAFLAALQFQALLGPRLDPVDTFTTVLHALTFTINLAAVHGEAPVVSWLAPSDTIIRDGMHTWSLAIEVHFYLLWGLILWFLSRRGASLRQVALVALSGVLAVMAVRAWMAGPMGRHATWFYFDTWPRMDAPLIGALLGVAFVAGWTTGLPQRVLTVAGTVGGVGFLAAAFTYPAQDAALPMGLYTLLAVAIGATLLAGVQGQGVVTRCLSWRPLRWFGTISYSLYLWHFGVFMAVSRRGGGLSPASRVLLATALAVGLAWLSYWFVERPFLRRKTRSAPSAAAVEVLPPVEVQRAGF